jgi:release factor glutamine methyltransferase
MRALLREGGIESAEREAEWLIEAVTGMDRAAIALEGSSVDDEIEARAVELVRRRIAGEPLQYLTGVAGFRRLDLAVGPGVLIPRPETEVVAERAMTLLAKGGTVVDVGTGAGAIALAVADERPDARVIATESSADAMSWAAKNRTLLGLDVELVLCDLLSGLPAELRGEIDVVVANLPYVARADTTWLSQEVVDHEPHEALFANDDELDVIRRLIRIAPDWLRPGGHLVLEIGEWHGPRVKAMLQEAGYEDALIDQDLNGRDRIAQACL